MFFVNESKPVPFYVHYIEEYRIQLLTYFEEYITKNGYDIKEKQGALEAPYIDITPYVAYAAIELLKNLDLKKFTNSDDILKNIESYLDKIMHALVNGSFILTNQLPFTAALTYKASFSAQMVSEHMLTQMEIFCEDLNNLKNFINEYEASKSRNSFIIKVLEIKFNLYKKNKVEIDDSFYNFNISGVMISNMLAAIEKNKYIKELEIQAKQLELNHFIKMGDLQNIKNLIIFDISNIIDNNCIDALRKSSITQLKVFSQNILDSTVILFCNFKQLTSIYLSSKKVTGAGLQLLCQIPQLVEIELCSDTITDESLKTLQLNDSRYLRLQSNNITRTGVKFLAEMQNIVELTIFSDVVSDNDVLPSFAINTTLKSLCLYGNKVKNPGYQYIACMTINPDQHPNKHFFINYLLSQKENDFLNTIVKNKEIATLVLQHKELSDKLNNVKVNGHNDQINANQQVFKQSCVAHAIMLLLHKLAYLTDAQVNFTKELEIYSKIWRSPGSVADLGLIQKYLESYNIRICVYEDKNYLEQLINSSSENKSYYNDMYKDKISTVQIRNVNILKHLFSEESYLILFTLTQIGPHGLICTYENQQYHVLDPADGLSVSNMSLEEIFKQKKITFSGVAIQAQSLSNAHQITKYSGIFTKPVPKIETVFTQPTNGCVIQ